MLTMSETRRQKIDRLRALLESGVSSDSTDGASTSFDLASVRKELVRLEREAGSRKKRSPFYDPDMTRR